MNLVAGDYPGLMRELALYRGKDIPAGVARAIHDKLERAGWQVAWRVVQSIRGERVVPSNLYGAISLLLEEQARRHQAGALTPQENDSPYNTAGIGPVLLGCLVEVWLYHRLALVRTQESQVGSPYPDIEDWHRNGRLETWSPLVDVLLARYHTAWVIAEARRSAEPIITCLTEYRRELRDERTNRAATADKGETC